MDDELEPVVHFALMQILATLFETGLVSHVALGDVLRLFGAAPDETQEPIVFSFDDPGWLQAYQDFRSNNIVPEIIAFDDDGDFGPDFGDDFGDEPSNGPDKKLH